MPGEHDVPTFGICLGMQCMVIEYARDVLGYKDANSTEMDVNTPHNVIDLMESQKCISNMGGTMRLGEYDCILKEGSKAAQLDGKRTSRGVIATVSNLMAITVPSSRLPVCSVWARTPIPTW